MYLYERDFEAETSEKLYLYILLTPNKRATIHVLLQNNQNVVLRIYLSTSCILLEFQVNLSS